MTSNSPKNWPRINPMGLSSPWENSYLQHQRKEQSSGIFVYQWLLIFLCVLLLLQLIKLIPTIMILRNFNITDLGTIGVYLTTSEISSDPPKIGQGLTQCALVPLWLTLINNNKESNSILWCLYINACFYFFV